MKNPRLFFCEKIDDENCFSLQYFKDKLIEDELTELELADSVPLYGDDCFYCKKFDMPGSSSQSNCGKDCKEYKPRNGKNGRCCFSGYCYTTGSRKFKLKKNGLEVIK